MELPALHHLLVMPQSLQGRYYHARDNTQRPDTGRYLQYAEVCGSIHTLYHTSSKPSTNVSKVPYKVRVDASDLRIRSGAGTNYPTTGEYTGKGTFTIIEEKAGTGSTKGWGKLKSGAGWISLDYCVKL